VKLTEDEYMHTNKENFEPLKDGRHCFFADAAVGCVELVEIMPGVEAAEYDFLRVLVHWSGHVMKAKVPGFIPPEFHLSRMFRQEFVLKRLKDVKSSDKNILASVHCPNCGAPETRSANPFCEYCHTPLNDGSRDWVLHEVRQFTGYPQPNSSRSPFASHTSIPGGDTIMHSNSDALLAGAAEMMLADGKIAPEEQAMLEEFARARKVSPERLELIVQSVIDGTLAPELPDDPKSVMHYLRALAAMCLADGKVTDQEQAFLEHTAEKLGFSKYDVKILIREQRRELFHKSRKLN
jgi:uncharacterized tellurite resistance protein B-like protein